MIAPTRQLTLVGLHDIFGPMDGSAAVTRSVVIPAPALIDRQTMRKRWEARQLERAERFDSAWTVARASADMLRTRFGATRVAVCPWLTVAARTVAAVVSGTETKGRYAVWVYDRGRVNLTVVPWPSVDSTLMEPPCCSTICFALAKPTPVPGTRLTTLPAR